MPSFAKASNAIMVPQMTQWTAWTPSDSIQVTCLLPISGWASHDTIAIK